MSSEKKSFSKVVDFIKENFLVIAITVVICTSFICSVSSLVLSKKSLSYVETLSSDYHNFVNKIAVKIDDIDDNIDFLRDWASNTPSITLGDTYLYHNIDAEKNKIKSR